LLLVGNSLTCIITLHVFTTFTSVLSYEYFCTQTHTRVDWVVWWLLWVVCKMYVMLLSSMPTLYCIWCSVLTPTPFTTYHCRVLLKLMCLIPILLSLIHVLLAVSSVVTCYCCTVTTVVSCYLCLACSALPLSSLLCTVMFCCYGYARANVKQGPWLVAISDVIVG